ncbi:MAG: hypothetical protein KGQ60_01895 [Planctomycetes bacterium]|nr:hypothetical protein [Planctomycetota bacterium]
MIVIYLRSLRFRLFALSFLSFLNLSSTIGLGQESFLFDRRVVLSEREDYDTLSPVESINGVVVEYRRTYFLVCTTVPEPDSGRSRIDGFRFVFYPSGIQSGSLTTPADSIAITEIVDSPVTKSSWVLKHPFWILKLIQVDGNGTIPIVSKEVQRTIERCAYSVSELHNELREGDPIVFSRPTISFPNIGRKTHWLLRSFPHSAAYAGRATLDLGGIPRIDVEFLTCGPGLPSGGCAILYKGALLGLSAPLSTQDQFKTLYMYYPLTPKIFENEAQ